MLIELRIKSFAVLEDLTVPLAAGLNVITGETGAGKSIVVDALTILLGGRSSSDVVRSGEERAVVEGVVDVRGRGAVVTHLAGLGLEPEDDHVVLRREVQREGRSRAWINGSPTTATVLRELGSHLVDIHGQHEHQRLLSVDVQQDVVDAFGGSAGLAAQVREIYRRSADLRNRMAALEDRSRELESRADFLRFQLGEIEGAELRADEEEELRIQISRLGHAEELARASEAVHQILYGADGSATEQLADTVDRLRRLAELDPSLAPSLESLEEAYHGVTDVAGRIRDYGSDIDHDPTRLEELQERLALLNGLKRKYGATVADVIETGSALRVELDELEAADIDAGKLGVELDQTEHAWREAAGELSGLRRDAALRLQEAAESLFPGLGLEGGRFHVEFEELAEPSARGRERIRFAVSLNPGFPPGPLSRIASGGELSRVMLALKSVLADLDETPTLVFDEIDAGIGGVVGARVGERLQAVAEGRQVLVVTHLAQIATRAANHLLVEKEMSGGLAATRLRALDGDERAREVARMLSGDPGSDSSLEHARELLGRDGAGLERTG